MIIGSIDNVETKSQQFNATLHKVFDYLKSTDFSTIADGSYPIGSQGIVAKVQRYKTRSPHECNIEGHSKFIDVQFVFGGEESLGWCPLSPDLVVEQPYNFATDVETYKALVPESCVVLSKNSFAVLYPSDVHRPGGFVEDNMPTNVTKVVVKIPVNLVTN